MYYAFIEDNKINGVGQCQCLNEEIINFEITEEIYNNIERYIWNGNNVVLDPDYEEKQRQKERERLDALFMTRSNFFDGFILAFGLGQSELRVIIENILNSINITPVEIKVALNNYDNALNFYRKHTLFTLLNNVEIPITEEMTLIFTSDIWDKFFDTKDYKELQKAIQVEPEPIDDDSDSDSDTDTEGENENTTGTTE